MSKAIGLVTRACAVLALCASVAITLRAQTFATLFIFDGPDGRDAYLAHPAHLAFCRRYLDPSLEEACVVDFQAIG